MIQDGILFLTTTDQRDSPLAKYAGISLKGSYDRDANFYQPLNEIFDRVIRYDYWKRLVEIGTVALQREILELARSEHPAWVTLPLSMYEISETTLGAMRKEGAIVVAWLADDECRFNSYSRWWIPYVDYFVTTSQPSVSRYNELGARCIYAPCAADPQLYSPVVGSSFRYDVSFVGARIADRAAIIRELTEQGIDVSVFGEGWSRFLSFDQMRDVFRQSRINLNFASSYLGSQVKQLKARVFEVTMCGGFLLTEYVPGIEDYFEVDKEIVCFATPDEAGEKIHYYLAHEDERLRIANAGCERAHRDHTWKQRLASVFGEIQVDIRSHGRPTPPESSATSMPSVIRRLPSNYHLAWAKALLTENRNGWQDELAIAIDYDPSNSDARVLRFAAHFPPVIRESVASLLVFARKGLRRLLPGSITRWLVRKLVKRQGF